MSFIKVEITAEPIEQGRSYQDKQTGFTKQTAAKQKAYLHAGLAYPTPFSVAVPEAGPYRPGFYLLAGDCFKPGQFGLDFRMNKLELVSIDDALASAKPPVVKAA